MQLRQNMLVLLIESSQLLDSHQMQLFELIQFLHWLPRWSWHKRTTSELSTFGFRSSSSRLRRIDQVFRTQCNTNFWDWLIVSRNSKLIRCRASCCEENPHSSTALQNYSMYGVYVIVERKILMDTRTIVTFTSQRSKSLSQHRDDDRYLMQ